MRFRLPLALIALAFPLGAGEVTHVYVAGPPILVVVRPSGPRAAKAKIQTRRPPARTAAA